MQKVFRSSDMSEFNRALYSMIGNKIKSLRIKKGLSQAELSNRVPKIGRTSISNIEKGNQQPPLHILYLICNELDVDLQAILPTYSEIQKEAELSNKDDVHRYLETEDIDKHIKEFLEKLMSKKTK